MCEELLIRGGRRVVRELGDLLRPQMRIPHQLLPGGVQRELLDLMDFVTALEQAAGCLMSEVVKT